MTPSVRWTTENRTLRVLILAGLLAAGGFLRLWNLGAASLWVDELNTHYSARSWNEAGKDLFPSGKQDGRAQALTLTTALSYRLFGMNEAATRLPSALFGILSICAAYGLARRLFGTNAGLMTAFFTAFSHFEVGWSRTARMYTLLQALTLCLAWMFLNGFERPTSPERPAASGLLKRISGQGVSLPWLAGFAAVTAAAFFWVHPLVALLLPGVWLYWLGSAAAEGSAGRGRNRLRNKYATAAALSVLAAAALLLLPGVRSTASYFLFYTPPWAAGESAARIRTLLLDFLVSGQRFPLAALFFIGTLMLISRPIRGGWLVWCMFAAPLAMLTLVFSHREPTYLFFVYPFFLMIAAFGFVRLIEGEMDRIGKGFRRLLLAAAAASVFVVSPWLRITAHIPFLPDGVTNTAVTPEEWREASAAARAAMREGDCVITSLPQAALYYGLRSDWCLNRAVAEQSVMENFPRDGQGRILDVYAGVPCVTSLDSLRALVEGRDRGWILVTSFHFENTAHVTPDIRAFLTERLGPPAATAHGTVLTFRWPRDAEGRP
ncbi:MAG: glycosyltransferase family 39 protein [bacterium]|nr:glycosyltransferase family 39 protein [bacterium]